MGAKKALLIFAVVAALAAAGIFVTWDRIVIYIAAKDYGLSMSYSSVKNMNFKELQFRDFTVIEKNRRAGLFASQATLWPAIGIQARDSRSLAFVLKGVRFIPGPKKGAGEDDMLMDLIAMPFSGEWAYSDIEGEVFDQEKGLFIRKLVATGDMMRLSVNGYLYKNNTVDANITIYFSKNSIRELPESVTGVVLKNEEGDWKSLSAHLTGDLSGPSIELSGKLFRLNIKQVTP